MKKRIFWVLQGFVILLALWWGFSFIFGERLIPPPNVVFPELVVLLGEGLFLHTLATLRRTLAALAVSLLLALPLGIAMGKVKWLDDLFSPLAYLLYPVPKIALLPVIMLIFGITDLAKIAVVTLVLFFQILLEVRGSVRAIPREYMISITSLGAKPSQRIRYVIGPYILPQVFTALRIGSGTALAVLFFAETFFTSRGLGFFIMDSWMRISYSRMFAGITMMAVLGSGLFLFLDLLEKIFCPWRKTAFH